MGKKTNFVVVFWLVLAAISFIAFLTGLYNVWRSISYLVIPSTEEYLTRADNLRDLLATVPMTIITVIFFVLFLSQGMRMYKKLSPNA
jgi:heme/copper-type cytochrome/quinol oxidase subunit 2